MILLSFIWLLFFILNNELSFPKKKKRKGNKFLTLIWVRIPFLISANFHAQMELAWLGHSTSKNPKSEDRKLE